MVVYSLNVSCIPSLGHDKMSGSAAYGLTDFSQVDKLGVRYKSVNFGTGKSPGTPDWRAQID